MPSITFRAIVNGRATRILADTIDAATDKATKNGQNLNGIYLDNPTPSANCRYGAPMGRSGTGIIDPDGRLSARRIALSCDGYDNGGAYWGSRGRGQYLYAVQDGLGNLAFVDADNAQHAKTLACA